MEQCGEACTVAGCAVPACGIERTPSSKVDNPALLYTSFKHSVSTVLLGL